VRQVTLRIALHDNALHDNAGDGAACSTRPGKPCLSRSRSGSIGCMTPPRSRPRPASLTVPSDTIFGMPVTRAAPPQNGSSRTAPSAALSR
jgi:hypothetical protein